VRLERPTREARYADQSEGPQLKELKPRIVLCGVGGAGGNAINNMIASGLSGVDFVVANTEGKRPLRPTALWS
jgi:cell division GTPase FtsZ